jgi:hypothetical protein
VVYTTTGGLETTSANLTFNGTTLTSVNDASISGLTVGKGGGAATGNSAVGYQALNSNTSGTYNTAVGYQALTAASTTQYNTAVGQAALQNTTSSNNTAVGQAAGYNTTTGNALAILGTSALFSNTTGQYNSAVGYQALYSNTTASNNTAVGYQAGYSNTTGFSNAFIGRQAGYYITTGNYNVALGDNSLIGASGTATGSSNTAIGVQALQANTTASNNTAVGYQAGYSTTTATLNSYFGRSAGYTATTGGSETGYNTFLGGYAGYNATGGSNTFVGSNAGVLVTTGQKNTIIGSGNRNGAGGLMTTGSSNTLIGNYDGNQGGLDIRTASNYIVLSDGDGNPTAIRISSDLWYFGIASTTNSGVIGLLGQAASGGAPAVFGYTGAYGSTTLRWGAGSNSQIKGGTTYDTYTVAAGSALSGGVNLTSGATSWTSASDARLKNVTGKYDNALADIAQLEPVKFTWKNDAENKPQVGVLAQSVEKVVPEAIDHIRVDKEDETDYLGVRYTELVPLLIASIQELKAEVDSLKQQLGK